MSLNRVRNELLKGKIFIKSHIKVLGLSNDSNRLIKFAFFNSIRNKSRFCFNNPSSSVASMSPIIKTFQDQVDFPHSLCACSNEKFSNHQQQRNLHVNIIKRTNNSILTKINNDRPVSNKNPQQTTKIGRAQHINFSSMADIQRLATEPSREHIENIRHMLRNVPAKNNDDQDINLEKDPKNGIATVRIKSGAKNGISAKMMCDFLDVIDELYSWDEGKGVIIYGHNNFFCSGMLCRMC